MRVELVYPPHFPLNGWDRGIFSIGVAKMFSRGYLSVTSLDDWRKKAGFQDEDPATRDDLHTLHCVAFKDLPKEVLDELPARVGRYIGVDVRRADRRGFFSVSRLIGPVQVGLLLAIGIGVPSLLFLRNSLGGHDAVPPPSLPAHQYPMAFPPVVPADPLAPVDTQTDPPADPVFSASMTTTQPAQSLHRIARAIPAHSGKWDVAVTVARSPDDIEVDRAPARPLP